MEADAEIDLSMGFSCDNDQVYGNMVVPIARLDMFGSFFFQ